MRTHLGARAVQAGALLALAGGMLAVVSSPAAANNPNVQVTNVQSRDLPSNGKTGLSFTVTNTNNIPTLFNISVQGNGGFNCTDGCSPSATIGPNQTENFDAQLAAPGVPDGQTQTFQVQIQAQAQNPQNDRGQATVQFTVHGADKPQTVRQVIGRIKDQNGKSVPGANVGMRDSQNHIFTTTSNDEGRFQFTSSDNNPIVPGTLTVGATKDGYKQATVNVPGTAGKTVNVPLTLQLVEATASASPSATESSPAATDDATQAATDAATPPAGVTTQPAAQDGKGNSMLYIILGALLVAAGVGAIVLLIMRRRSKRDGGDDLDDFGGGGGGPVPPSQGRYHRLPDATRVAAPVGAAAGDATMVARQPSISDAPTMMQPAVPAEDEFPDPYGAPALPGGYAGAGGYGGAAAGAGYGSSSPYGGAGYADGQYGGAGYGDGGYRGAGYADGGYGGAGVPAQSGGYDSGPPTQFGAGPQDVAGYGAYAGAGGYDQAEPQRYDEPTGMYRPEVDNGGYPQENYGRGSGGGQDREPGGYGSWGAPAGGIDSGNGYGPASGQYGAGPDSARKAGAQYGGGQSQYGAQYGSGQYGDGGQHGSAPYGGGQHSGAPQYGDDQYRDGQYRDGQYGDEGRYGGSYGPDQGGYGRSGSYDRGGYDQGGSYGGDSGGGDRRGYYGGEQGGARHGGQSRPAETPPRSGQRRNIDWLDD